MEFVTYVNRYHEKPVARALSVMGVDFHIIGRTIGVDDQGFVTKAITVIEVNGISKPDFDQLLQDIGVIEHKHYQLA